MDLQLKGNLNGGSLSLHLRKFVAAAGHTFPREVSIDCSRLTFITPAGVTFLSNFVRWLVKQGSKVQFIGLDAKTAPLKYLDDAGFFLQHCGRKLFDDARQRSTTLPLCTVDSAEAHQWIRNNMTPWLARTVNRRPQAVYSVTACLSEIFNNIGDHSHEQIGSIFAQHFPNKRELSICVADFGRGIPTSVKGVHPELADGDCILRATERGFTTGGKNNQGEGLDYLLATTVGALRARVEIRSLHGHVLFLNIKGVVTPHLLRDSGFVPGTSIDITLRSDLFVDDHADSEDLIW